MDLTILPRLQQLQAELDSFATSSSRSVLYGFRRELLRYYRQIPGSEQQTWPRQAQRDFVHELGLLAAEVPFPAPSLSQQIAALQQSLLVLRQTLQYPSNPLRAAARLTRPGKQATDH